MGAKEVLTRRNMRLINVFAAVLIAVAWVTRFYYFTKREVVKEKEVTTINTEGASVTEILLVKEEEQDGFWLILYTIFVFPVLIFIYLIQEF